MLAGRASSMFARSCKRGINDDLYTVQLILVESFVVLNVFQVTCVQI